jgi:integrase
MARKVRDATLDSKVARRELKARGKPYFKTIEPGLHLGYRKRKGGAAGTWVARHYVGEQSYQIEKIGVADDVSDADGVIFLDIWQAQAAAQKRAKLRRQKGAGKSGPLTVGEAMDTYLEFLESNRKSAGDARYRYEAFIRPEFGNLEAAALKRDKIRKWLDAMSRQAPRLRTKKGKEQKFRPLGKDDETKRRRKASANRTLTVLKAALNRAWRDGLVASNREWRAVEPFEDVDAARVQYLAVAEARRLINACDPGFRRLVQAALETGARYGELGRMQVRDFHLESGTLHIPTSKSGKPRHVVLTDEGTAFFKEVCAGRPGSELMFPKANGSPWLKSEQARPMADACERAKIAPPIGFHGLRHTWASLAVMAGVPLLVVAKNLGHSDTRMVEKHYGHLAPSYIVDAIRAGAPKFGFKPDPKIATLAGRAS